MVLRTLIAVGVMSTLLGSPALGEPIIFDNRNGEFVWYAFCPCQEPGGTFVDITQSPSQNGESGDMKFGLFYEARVATPHYDAYSITDAPGFPPGIIQVAADDEATLVPGDDVPPQPYYFARELGPGDIVDGGLNLRNLAYVRVANYYLDPPALLANWGPCP